MKQLRAFIARQRRRSERWPRLDDALVTDRGLRYAAYRLRYTLVRVGLRTALHVVELVFFSLVFPLEWLAPVFVIRTGATLFTALWWGALEALRERVRACARAQKLGEAGAVIDDWLVASAGVALLVGLAVGLWVPFGPDPVGGFSIFDAYAVATGVRVGLETMARAYHSGLFALRRVYRPLSSLLLVDVLDLAAPIALWPWFGTWSFAVSVLSVGLLRVTLFTVYTRRAYRRSGLGPRRPRDALRRALRGRGAVAWTEAAKFALGAAVGQVDALVLLTLILGSHGGQGGLHLAATLFVLTPLLGAGVSWARVFYFDFKRLELGAPALLVQRFERLLGLVSLVFPLVAWGFAIAVAWLLVPALIGWSVLALLPFFVARSLFALRYVQAFAYRDQRVLLELAAAVLAGVGLVAMLPQEEAIVFGALTLVLAIAAALVPAARRRPTRSDGAPAVNLLSWLAIAAGVEQATRIFVVRFDRRLASYGKLCRALRREIHRGAFARLAAGELVCFAVGEAREAHERTALVRAGGGCVTELRCVGVGASGRAALAIALEDPRLAQQTDPGRRRRRRRAERDPAPSTHALGAALRDDFRRWFPNGEVISMHDKAAATFRLRPRSDVRQLMALVWACGSDRPPERVASAGVDAAVYAPLGDPALLFVMPRTAPGDRRADWKARVQRDSVRASLAALGLTESGG